MVSDELDRKCTMSKHATVRTTKQLLDKIEVSGQTTKGNIINASVFRLLNYVSYHTIKEKIDLLKTAPRWVSFNLGHRSFQKSSKNSDDHSRC